MKVKTKAKWLWKATFKLVRPKENEGGNTDLIMMFQSLFIKQVIDRL